MWCRCLPTCNAVRMAKAAARGSFAGELVLAAAHAMPIHRCLVVLPLWTAIAWWGVPSVRPRCRPRHELRGLWRVQVEQNIELNAALIAHGSGSATAVACNWCSPPPELLEQRFDLVLGKDVFRAPCGGQDRVWEDHRQHRLCCTPA
jgi:hypothetical protein